MTFPRSLNGHAQKLQAKQGATAILAARKIFDRSPTFCDGSEYGEPVGYRFIARHLNGSNYLPRGTERRIHRSAETINRNEAKMKIHLGKYSDMVGLSGRL